MKPKIVPAESVRQALQFVQSGNAEVGFVGRAIADVREAVAVPLPLDACDPIIQSLGVVARSDQPRRGPSVRRVRPLRRRPGDLARPGFRRVPKAGEAVGKGEPEGEP